MEWIKITDRLPEEHYEGLSKSILIYDGEYVDVGHYDYNVSGFEQYGKFVNSSKVIHWMPLPEPPKE